MPTCIGTNVPFNNGDPTSPRYGWVNTEGYKLVRGSFNTSGDHCTGMFNNHGAYVLPMTESTGFQGWANGLFDGAGNPKVGFCGIIEILNEVWGTWASGLATQGGGAYWEAVRGDIIALKNAHGNKLKIIICTQAPGTPNGGSTPKVSTWLADIVARAQSHNDDIANLVYGVAWHGYARGNNVLAKSGSNYVALSHPWALKQFDDFFKAHGYNWKVCNTECGRGMYQPATGDIDANATMSAQNTWYAEACSVIANPNNFIPTLTPNLYLLCEFYCLLMENRTGHDAGGFGIIEHDDGSVPAHGFSLGPPFTNLRHSAADTAKAACKSQNDAIIAAGGIPGNFTGTAATINTPTVTTDAPTSVTSTSATLNAHVNPNGNATTYQFQWGNTTSYGNVVPASPASIGGGSSSVTVNQAISGLTAGVAYHYRVIATNSGGTSNGADQTFTTTATPNAPVVVTSAATSVTVNSATLNGTVNPSGFVTSYHFEYGLTTAYGSRVPAADVAAGAGTTAVAVNQAITGLAAGTYHYRLVATNVNGTSAGGDQAFTTAAPGAMTLTVDPSDNSRVLIGNIPANAQRLHIRLASDLTGGNTTFPGNQGPPFGDLLAPFPSTYTPPSTRPVVAMIAWDSASADIGTWTDPVQTTPKTTTLTPTATIGSATNVTPTSATLNGTINPNGAASQYHFEYGTTTAYGTSIPIPDQSVGNGTSPVSVSQNITGLTANTTYHFRLVAVNAAGTTLSADQTFPQTAGGTPSVTTSPATSVTSTSAQFNGQIDSQGLSTSYHFDYGTTTTYGTKTPVPDITLPVSGGIAYGVTNSNTSTGGTTLTIPATALTDGRRLLGVIVNNGGATTVTPPAGWSLLGTHTFAKEQGTIYSVSIFTKTASAEAPSTWTLSASHPSVGYVLAFDGADTTTPWADVGGAGVKVLFLDNSPASLVCTVPSVTGSPGQMEVMGAIFPKGDTYTWPAGSTERVDILNAAVDLGVSASAGTQAIATSGSTGTRTVTIDNSGGLGDDTSCGFALLLNSGSGSSSTNVSANVSGLSANITYHYRLVAANSQGTTNGADQSFVTVSPTLPVVTTDPATAVQQSTANLNGRIAFNSPSGSYHFEYGTTTAYGTTVPIPDQVVSSATGTMTFVRAIGGLTPATTYHFRLVATNSAGTTAGSDHTFATSAPTAPVVVTSTPTSVADSSAVLNGTINPNGLATSYHYDWGMTVAYGNATPTQTVSAGNVTVSTPVLLTGLGNNITFHTRLVATNSAGTSLGGDTVFTTASAPVIPPIVVSTGAIDFDWAPKGAAFTYPVGAQIIAPDSTFYTPVDKVLTFSAATGSDIIAVEYYWDFGDGTFGYGNPIQHSYKVPNLHAQTVLRVTDNLGDQWFMRHQMYLKPSAIGMVQPVLITTLQ